MCDMDSRSHTAKVPHKRGSREQILVKSRGRELSTNDFHTKSAIIVQKLVEYRRFGGSRHEKTRRGRESFDEMRDPWRFMFQIFFHNLSVAGSRREFHSL